MTLRVQGEILMDADQAKAELQATGTAARGAAKDVDTLGREGTGAARDVTRLGRAADSSATRLTSASAAARANATATRSMAASNKLAAGSMGNLVAQGNDVITMLAAGQDPLTLALQQGTQITQVIGPLGAAGAFRALGGAVLSMLSPINLITIGAIAATAAVVNWFRSGSDEALSFADRVDQLGTRIDGLRDRIEDASRTRVELAEEFGDSFVTRAQTLLDQIVAAEQRAAGRAATATITGFLGETDLNLDAVITARTPDRPSSSIDEGLVENARAQLARQFELAEGLFGRLTGQNRQLVQQVLDDLADLSLAAEGTLQEQQAALAALIESYDRAAVASGSRNPAEEENLKLLREQELKLAEVIELQKQDPAQNRRTEEMLTFLAAVTKSTGEQLRANAAAEAMLGTLTQQNALAQAIARSGADSAEVTRLRAQFALDAKLEEIEASKASEKVKQELRDAALAAFDIATADMSGAIGAAADEAARLSDAVRSAVDGMFDLATQGELDLEIARLRVRFKDDPARLAEEIAAERAARRFDQQTEALREGEFPNPGEESFLNSQRQAAIDRAREAARLNEQARPTRSSRGGTRRTGVDAAERERQSIDRLIETKRRETEALRESDPVQRQMIQLRERLTAATPRQRAELETLIEVHEAERVAMERKQEFEDGIGDALLEARSLKDVWQGIGNFVARAAQEALLLGRGPLAGLFGGAGGGGLLGGLVSGIGSLFGFAGGGLPGEMVASASPGVVLGAGTGRSDSILARISAGEFIMTAQATARNRELLEAMNDGAHLPGFAAGGLPLPRQALPSGAAAVSGATLFAEPRGIREDRARRIEVVARVENGNIVQTIEETSARVGGRMLSEALSRYDRETLPRSVERIGKDPRRRG